MGRKNERERQQRRQRRQEKRKAQRTARRTGGAGAKGRMPPSRELAIPVCIGACEALLAGCGRLDADLREVLLTAARHAAGVWLRLPFELESFLHDGAPWSLTCAELEPARLAFERQDADEAFERLWALALTNEPGVNAFAAAPAGSCAHRAALAFQSLRDAFDDSASDGTNSLDPIEQEIKYHGGSPALVGAYKKVLKAAVASLHAGPASRAKVVDKLVRDCRKIFDRYSREHADTAWWACGRVFLAEVFSRHAERGDAAGHAELPGLATYLFGSAEAALWLARIGSSAEPLRAIHVQSTADAWLRCLGQCIDARALAFEDRLRYEISRLKLLRACARSHAYAQGAPQPVEFLRAFEELCRFLAHGVPRSSRDLPGILEPALVDFYIGAVEDLDCHSAALQTTEALFRRHADDFRLACLYAVGALLHGRDRKLHGLDGRNPKAHFDAELFARSIAICADLPRGANGSTAMRTRLFDPLDREHRKQCLITLSRHALRRATSFAEYEEELRRLLPFFECDNFVHRELREGAALESALIFLATMMAPLHGLQLSLTESQSQQWVSYARDIARLSSFAARLVAQHLKTPSRSFALTPSVRAAAQAANADIEGTAAATGAVAPKSARPKPARRRRKSASPQQIGLFDAPDP